MPADFFLRNFLSTMVQALDHRDQEVVNTWTDALVETIRRVTNATAHREITPVVLAKAQGSKSVSSRVCSCRLLGELATKYDPQMLKKDLIPTITALLLDANPEVRSEMTKYLVKVPPHLGPELTTNCIINPLGELSGDDILAVRQNCFLTMVESLPYFHEDSIKTNIQTMLKNMLTNAICKNDDGFLMTASEHYDKMYTILEKYLTTSEKEFFIRFYTTMSGLRTNFQRREDFDLEQDINSFNNCSVVRKNCANIFPIMARFQLIMPAKKPLKEFLRESFKPFVSDASSEVRKTIASRFKEVCDLIPKDCNLIKDEFIILCEDDNNDVLDCVIPNLYPVMEFFQQNGVFRSDSNDEYLNAAMRAFVKCENTLCRVYRWRTYVTFLEQTRDLYKIVPSDLLFHSLIACSMKIIHLSRVVPVRKEAMKNLLVFMRHTTKLQERKEIKDKIIRDFCLSKNFYDRIIYVRIVPVILDLYSTTYFKENFYIKTLKLFEDPVSNIRYTLLKVLPHLKVMVKIPQDIKLQQYLTDALNALSEDKDRDVQQLYQSMKSELEKVDFSKLFPNDKKKYDEEKMLLFDKKDERTGTFGRGGGRFMRPPQRRRPNFAESLRDSHRRIPTASPNSQHQTRRSTRSTSASFENLKEKNFHRIGEMSSQEKEFYIDAGVHLPDGIDQIPKVSSSVSNNNNNNNVNTNKTTQKRWNSPRIPVRRPTSLEIKDYNKTNTSTITTNSNSTTAIKEKTSLVTTSRKSHLPRPLSCINFQTSSTTMCDYRTSTSSKQKLISRLPVVNRNHEQQNHGKS